MIDRRQFIAAAAAAVAVPAFAAGKDMRVLSGRTRSFDEGWRFLRGFGDGLEVVDLDDSAWRLVDLPHDWSIEDLAVGAAADSAIAGPFDPKAEGGTATGFAIGGEGWYRKSFATPADLRQRVEILFDGIYANSDLWLNGRHLGHHANGYTPSWYDLTPHLSRTGNNVLAVRVRNLGRNSRWYSGSGIYRHVWVDLRPISSRIARWGVNATTHKIDGGWATVEIETNLEDVVEGTSLVSRILDPTGRPVWEGIERAATKVAQKARIPKAALWSPEKPALYTLETTVRRGGATIDTAATRFGIRIISFDASRGIVLNGAPIKLRGGCIHHDNGLLGAAAFDGAEERKVRLMKARGYNAVRAAHNPYSPGFLDACDRLGMMVIAEAFDMWRWPKTPQDYSTVFDANWRADLSTMVLEMRHRPSVIMWSIGNEIPHRNLPEGVKLQWELGNLVHQLDPSRPVTAAINDFQGRELVPSIASARPGRGAKADQASMVFLDVAGYNYKVENYEAEHAHYPQRIIYGSESFSKDMFRTWEIADRSPWLLGDFVWTALDYLGEAGLGGSAYVNAKYATSMGVPPNWPWVVSDCGEVDLIGRPKAAAFARDVLWGRSPLEIVVQKPVPDGKVEVPRLWGWRDERPSWTWPGAEGKPLSVSIYTVGDRVELTLNGKTVARRHLSGAGARHVELTVPYAAGVLEAVAFSGEKRIGRRTLTTAAPAAAIRMTPERPTLAPGRGDLAFLNIELVDGAGRHAGDLEVELRLEIEGPAELAGFGSANPLAVGSFRQPIARSWNARALAILRSTGQSGDVRVRVSAETLRSATVSLPAS